MIETIEATCPYCWERFDTTVDCSGGSDRFDVRRENE
jgi:hypothetical protein